MARNEDQDQQPVVWLLTDHKPGHRNQLRGLGERLQARAGTRNLWIGVDQYPVPLVRALLRRPPAVAAPRPDLIIAAGTGTRNLLLACRGLGALTVVLMRPSFPLRWVDLAIIPAHDSPPQSPQVLVTRGVLNAVTPRQTQVHERRGLILLGGPSRHFDWEDDSVYEQLLTLARDYPDWQWTLTSSRRTPASLVARLRQLSQPNLRYYHHEQTPPEWLPETLAASRLAWVTPDSVSMVYEAMTAGLPTGLFRLEPVRKSRVARGLQGLLDDGLVRDWAQRQQLMAADPAQSPSLWEADRAAAWLLERYKELRQ